MTGGRFITVEGVEGAGKSTNLKFVAGLIRKTGKKVLITREPGGTMIGERIRDLLLDRSEDGVAPMAELLLMFAARAQHMKEVIRPTLDRGEWVVCDRFTDSSYAYQGGGRELGAEVVRQMVQLVLGDFRPDLTILFDVDVATGLARATKGTQADRFESEKRAFFERARKAFLDRARENRPCHVIDASKPIDQVQAEITEILTGFLAA